MRTRGPRPVGSVTVEGIRRHLGSIKFRSTAAFDSKAAASSIASRKSPRGFLAWDFQLAALGGAAALALAGVLALTALIAGLAAALSFTGVLSFAGVRALVPHGLERNSRGSWFTGCEGADGHRSGHQTGNRGARKECFRCIHLVSLVFAFEFPQPMASATARNPKFGKSARSHLLIDITLRSLLCPEHPWSTGSRQTALDALWKR